MRRPAMFCASLALLAGCATAPPPAVDPKAEASARMQMGISHLRQNNIPMAMRELKEASRLDPGNAEIDLGFGFAYQARGEHAEAERHFREAIRKRPSYPEAHNGLGTALGFQGKGAEALKEFEIAAKDVYYLTPEMAWFNMGEEYRRARDFRKAEEMYGKALAANDRFLDAHLARAQARAEDRRLPEAAAGLEEALSRHSPFVQGQFELGRIYMRMGRYEDARKMFLALSASSSDPSLRRMAADQINLIDGRKR
jgi:type IV pilus biogenesis/stability protein PilW